MPQSKGRGFTLNNKTFRLPPIFYEKIPPHISSENVHGLKRFEHFRKTGTSGESAEVVFRIAHDELGGDYKQAIDNWLAGNTEDFKSLVQTKVSYIDHNHEGVTKPVVVLNMQCSPQKCPTETFLKMLAENLRRLPKPASAE